MSVRLVLSDGMVVLDDSVAGERVLLAGVSVGPPIDLSVLGNGVLQQTVSGGVASYSIATLANPSAKFIVQQPDASLPNAQALSALASGLVKNTTATGVLSIASDGVDYLSPATGVVTVSGTAPIVATGAHTVVLSLATNGVTNNFFRQSQPVTLVGNPTGSLANVQDIQLGTGLAFVGTTLTNSSPLSSLTASAPIVLTGTNLTLSVDATLAVSGGALSRAAVTGDVTIPGASNVAAFRTFAADSVLARALGTPGVPSELSASADGQVLVRAGGVLTWGSVPSTSVTGAPGGIAYFDGTGELTDDPTHLAWNSSTFLMTTAGAVEFLNSAAAVSVVGSSALRSNGGLLQFSENGGPWKSFDTTFVLSTRVINTTAPLTGGGALSSDLTLGVATDATLAVVGGALSRSTITGPVTIASGSNVSVVGTNVITSANLRQSVALSVVGNPTNATANVQDIVAGAGLFLGSDGTTLAFQLVPGTSVTGTPNTAAYFNGSGALSSLALNGLSLVAGTLSVATDGTSVGISGGLVQRLALTGAVTAAAGSGATVFGTTGAFSALMNPTGGSAVPTFVGPATAGQFLGQTGWSSVPGASVTGTANTTAYFNGTGALLGAVDQVANVAALEALPASVYRDGGRVRVTSLNDDFFFHAVSSLTVDDITVASASGAPGSRWIRREGGRRAEWAASYWIDPVAGNDQNAGTTSGTPLKTGAELTRRLKDSDQASSVTVTIAGDMPDSDPLVVSTQSRGSLTIQGSATVVASGTIASAVAASYTTNQLNQVTITGFNWAPFVGSIIRLQGTSGSTGTYAAVVSDSGGGTALLGPQVVNLAVVLTSFAAGQTIEVLSYPKVSGLFVVGARPATVSFVEIRLANATSISLNRSSLGTNLTFNRCVIDGGGTAGLFSNFGSMLFNMSTMRSLTFESTVSLSLGTGSVLVNNGPMTSSSLAGTGQVVWADSVVWNSPINFGDYADVQINTRTSPQIGIGVFGLQSGQIGLAFGRGSIVEGAYLFGANNSPSSYVLGLSRGAKFLSSTLSGTFESSSGGAIVGYVSPSSPLSSGGQVVPLSYLASGTVVSLNSPSLTRGPSVASTTNLSLPALTAVRSWAITGAAPVASVTDSLLPNGVPSIPLGTVVEFIVQDGTQFRHNVAAPSGFAPLLLADGANETMPAGSRINFEFVFGIAGYAWQEIWRSTVGGVLTGSLPNPSLVNFGPGAVTTGGSGIASITTDATGRVASIATATYLQDPGSSGFTVRIATGATVSRTLTNTDGTIVITNPDGVAGNPILNTTGLVPTSRTLTGTAPISIAGDHAAHDLSANRVFSLDLNGVTYPFLQQGAALSVPGRASNSTGNWADIVAVAGSGGVLRESGSTIGFGNITEGSVTNLVTDLASKAPTTRTIATTLPLTGGGDLSADRTLGINVFGPSGPSHSTGAVPDPGASAGTSHFLREDGTWAVPSGGTVTSVTATLPLVSSGGATPNLTLNFDNSSITLNGSNQIQIGTLANGTPAAGNITFAQVAAPATPAAGHTAVWADSTNGGFWAKTGGGVASHTARSQTAVSTAVLSGLHDDGTWSLAVAGTDYVQAASATAPITNVGTAASPVFGLANSGVVPGSYTNTNITVGADGRITAASSGSSGAAFYQTFELSGGALTQRAAANFSSSFSLSDNAGAGRTDVALAATGVTPGLWIFGASTFTVNSFGQLTAVSTGNFYTDVQSDGVAVTHESTLNFQAPLHAADSGGSPFRTNISLTSGTGLSVTGGALTVNLSTGTPGGQSAIGGTAAGEQLTLSSTVSGTKGHINVGGVGAAIALLDEATGKSAWGQTSVDAHMHVVTASDTTPGVVTAWDNRHFVVGATGSTGGGLALSTHGTGQAYITALVPNSNWMELFIQAHDVQILSNGVTPGFFQDDLGNIGAATLAAGGVVTADIGTGQLRVASSPSPTFKWSQGYTSSGGMLENSKTILVPGDSGMLLTSANSYTTTGNSVINTIAGNWASVANGGPGTFYFSRGSVTTCTLDLLVSYAVATSVDLTNTPATLEFSLWFADDVTNAGAVWRNPIVLLVNLGSSAGGTVTTGSHSGSFTFGSTQPGPLYVFLSCRRTDFATGTSVSPVCFTATAGVV